MPASTPDLSSHRPLGQSGFQVAPVALGCWPIAGVTSVGVNDDDSIATIQACFDLGMNHLDTAYVYGPQGESEKLIRQAIAGRREELVIATKGGIHFAGGKTTAEMKNDAHPSTLLAECDASLRRLGTDHVELYYLHSPDPEVPIEESATAIGQLIAAGKVRAAGASNCSLEQLKQFHAVCPLAAVQLPYNMLQRGIEQKTIPWCQEQGIAVMVYWPLMKGLLAGKMGRDYAFDTDDPRQKYAMFHGEEWERNQDFLDRLRAIAAEIDCSVAQLVVAWTIAQPGITAALCGAKRPAQIEETAKAMSLQLTPEQWEAIDQAILQRGTAVTNRHFE